MNNSLAILIPTFIGREKYLQRLLDILMPQIENYKDDVKLFILGDNRNTTTGWKRNKLTEMAVDAGCTHRAFCDDDDLISRQYLDLNMPGVYGDFDCNSLVGIYSINGYTNPNKHLFYHSIKYDRWWDDANGYYRSINHLNTVKLSLVHDIKFPEINTGEDGKQAEALVAANRLGTEYEIKEPFYFYLDRTKENGI